MRFLSHILCPVSQPISYFQIHGVGLLSPGAFCLASTYSNLLLTVANLGAILEPGKLRLQFAYIYIWVRMSFLGVLIGLKPCDFRVCNPTLPTVLYSRITYCMLS